MGRPTLLTRLMTSLMTSAIDHIRWNATQGPCQNRSLPGGTRPQNSRRFFGPEACKHPCRATHSCPVSDNRIG